MRDRYYILFLVLAIAALSGWFLVINNSRSDVLTYDGREVVGGAVTARTEARLISSETKKRVLGEKVEAASSTASLAANQIAMDPIRVAGSRNFDTTASSVLIMNEETGGVLWGKREQEQRSIASITKLFTALVFLDFNPGWDKEYVVKNSDRRDGGKIYLWSGEKVKVRDLFYLSLVASGNSETVSLVNSTGLGEELFIKKMNEKAKAMGLTKTVFKDVVGLNEGNVSSALEIARFAREALSKKEINMAVKTSRFKFKTQGGREAQAESTDELLFGTDMPGLALHGGKTGYNVRAGYCFVGKFTNAGDHPVISVVLGEANKKSRFTQTLGLVRWTYGNYAWPESVQSE